MRGEGQCGADPPTPNLDPDAASVTHDVEPPSASCLLDEDGKIRLLAAHRRNRHQVAEKLDFTRIPGPPQRAATYAGFIAGPVRRSLRVDSALSTDSILRLFYQRRAPAAKHLRAGQSSSNQRSKQWGSRVSTTSRQIAHPAGELIWLGSKLIPGGGRLGSGRWSTGACIQIVDVHCGTKSGACFSHYPPDEIQRLGQTRGKGKLER